MKSYKGFFPSPAILIIIQIIKYLLLCNSVNAKKVSDKVFQNGKVDQYKDLINNKRI